MWEEDEGSHRVQETRRELTEKRKPQDKREGEEKKENKRSKGKTLPQP